jgi:hypothetical protein
VLHVALHVVATVVLHVVATVVLHPVGRIIDPAGFYWALYNGGVVQSPALRSKVWKTVLGQYSLRSSDAEREQRDAAVRAAYEALLSEIKPLVGEVSRDVSSDDRSFPAQCGTIDLDVERADFAKDPTGVYVSNGWPPAAAAFKRGS